MKKWRDVLYADKKYAREHLSKASHEQAGEILKKFGEFAIEKKTINKKFITIRKKHEEFALSKKWTLDHDKLDYHACCAMLRNGNKRFKVERALKENSPNLNDRHKNIDAYIKKTVGNAYNKVRYKDKKIRGRNRKTVTGLSL